MLRDGSHNGPLALAFETFELGLFDELSLSRRASIIANFICKAAKSSAVGVDVNSV